MASPARAPLWDKGPNDQRLLKFLLMHMLIGLAAGGLCAGAMIAFDIAHLRALLATTREAGLAVFMFVFAMAFLFGAMAMGVGVMTLPRDIGYGAGARHAVRDEEGPAR